MAGDYPAMLMTDMKKETLGTAGLILVTVFWGGGFIATELALDAFSTFQVMAMRFVFASAVFFPISFKQLKKLPGKGVWSGIVMGLFLFSAFLLQTLGLKHSTPSKNAFLTATNVVFVPLIVFAFQKKKPSVQEMIAVVLAMAGAGTMSFKKGIVLGIGDSLSLLCAVCFAFHIYFTSLFVQDWNPVALNFVQMCTAALLSLLSVVFSGDWAFHFSSGSGLWSIAYLCLISTALNYFLQTMSQKYVSPMKSSLILSLEGVFATIFSVVLLHEQLSVKGIAGSVLILSAVLVSEIRSTKNQEEPKRNDET